MRAKFLKECGGVHVSNKEIIAAALRAGYSTKKAPQKVAKFKGWLAEEANKSRLIRGETNPAATRSVITGKLLPAYVVLAERAQTSPAIVQGEIVSDEPTAPRFDALAGFRDDEDGTGERISFDSNGNLLSWFSAPGASPYRRQPKPPSYNSGLHLSFADVCPSWGLPEIHPAPIEEDDPIGNPDLLPQATFEPGVTAHFVR